MRMLHKPLTIPVHSRDDVGLRFPRDMLYIHILQEKEK